MGVQKEDVEKFLHDNPAFATKYFCKTMSPSSISKISGLPEKEIDFGKLEELCRVSYIFDDFSG